MPMAAQELHPGAIYLHGGKNYMSVDFKYTPGLGRATVVPYKDRSMHTKPLYSTMPKIIDILERSTILGLNAVYCTLEMTQTVFGYVKKDTRSGHIIGRADLTTPLIYTYQTRGFAFTAPEPVKESNLGRGEARASARGSRCWHIRNRSTVDSALAAGLAACMLIAVYVLFETSLRIYSRAF